MLSEYQCLRKLGSFSIDDPEAGRKLVENLDRRRVRLQVIEACWHFGFKSPDGLDRMRVKAFLDGLCRRGELVKVAGGLYCRPDMTAGRASVGDAFDKLAALFSRARPVISTAKPTAAAEEPKETLREYRKRTKASKPPAPNAAPPAPTPVEAAPPKPIPNLQRQTEWILRWMRSQGGAADKTAMVEAAVAAGIAAARSDLDVPLQRLFNRTRAYLKGGQIALTQFGERDAEYLDLRRDALDPPINDA